MKIRTFYESTLNPSSQKPEYGIEKIFLSEDNSFMIYKNNLYPLEFINIVQFGDPRGLKSVVNENKTILVGRDIAKHIIYRTEFKDFIIVLSYDSSDNSYKFNSIKFQNKVYRNLL
jgi:hypothetical protein